jgi:hypothetical protein
VTRLLHLLLFFITIYLHLFYLFYLFKQAQQQFVSSMQNRFAVLTAASATGNAAAAPQDAEVEWKAFTPRELLSNAGNCRYCARLSASAPPQRAAAANAP